MHDKMAEKVDGTGKKAYLRSGFKDIRAYFFGHKNIRAYFFGHKETQELKNLKTQKTMDFQIRTYGIGELAHCYAPNITTGAARRKLMYWISLQPALTEALRASGFSRKVRSFTPGQVKLIIEALGEP